MKKLFALLLMLTMVSLALPAWAVEVPGYAVTIGGRIKADVGWQVLSGDPNPMHNNTDDTLVNFFMAGNNNHYLRAMFSSDDKTTGAHIEIGMAGELQNLTNNGGVPVNLVYLRFAYGWYNIGNCKLLFGQVGGRLGDRYYPGQTVGTFKSGKIEMNGFGFPGGGTRNPKIVLMTEVNENFGFDLSIGQAGAEHAFGGEHTIGGVDQTSSSQSYLPKLELVLDFKFGYFEINPGAGISYQKVEFANNNVGADDSVLSYMLWLPFKFTYGPFHFMFSSHYSQNHDTDWTGESLTGLTATTYSAGGVMRDYHLGGQPMALPVYDANGNLEDTKTWAVGVSAWYSFTEDITLKTGWGITRSSNDAWGDEDSFTQWAAFVALPITISSNFMIQPEVSYWDYGDYAGPAGGGFIPGADAGSEWIIGMHFQFLF
jgi:hypothetical protein